MAAVTNSESARGYTQGAETKPWGHQRTDSEDQRQNFSYPQVYSQSPTPQPPADTDEKITTPATGAFSNDLGAVSGFDFYDSPHNSHPDSVLSDRAVNRLDDPKSRPRATFDRNGRKEENVKDHSRQQTSQYSTMANAKGKGAAPKKFGSQGLDKSKWIHRDKLTAIEIQEHIDLGRDVPPELLRKMEQSEQSGRGRSQQQTRPDEEETYGESLAEYKHQQQIVSPTSEAKFDEYEDYDDSDDSPFVPTDPRTPEEIAADAHGQNFYQTHLRQSSSRIPLSTSSPVPVPQGHLDRNAPLPRKRGASGTFDETMAYPGSRSRRNSVGSQVLLDEDLGSSPSSPTKARAPSKTPMGRKTSSTTRASTATKPRNQSAARGSPATRPTTRDGHRPSTSSQRPEGDPPWLNTMYKPDPRLPPDQQLLPTVRKRMMQEQWEKEGKAGQTFDRELNPTSVFPDEANERHKYPPPKPLIPVDDLHPEDAKAGTWPLAQSPSSNNMQRVPSNAEAHARYSTVPKVPTTPVVGARNSRPEMEGFQTQQEVDEESGQKKKRGCCCIVM